MRRGVLAIAAALALGAAAAAPAAAEDAPFIGYTSFLPALPGSHASSAFDDCADGSPGCVYDTLEEMHARLDALIHEGDCDHNAVFALTYIIVTEIYRDVATRMTADGPEHTDYFDEPDFLAREDSVFARLYFEARDRWTSGKREAVPPAWRIAFGSADRRELSAAGNMLQGINAHVNRDMPFMLAGLGLVRPDGKSRKPDHDRFNQQLNSVYDDTVAEIAERFDPSVRMIDHPATPLDNLVWFQALPLWREQVWRHAEMLVNAPSAEARAAVAQWIEQYAAVQGRLIREGTLRHPYGGDSSARDAHCRRHHGL